jgi:hypothetical protein
MLLTQVITGRQSTRALNDWYESFRTALNRKYVCKLVGNTTVIPLGTFAVRNGRGSQGAGKGTPGSLFLLTREEYDYD